VSARVWFARDTGFTADPKVQVLGDEHGPGGPLVIEEMLALAKLRNNGGSFAISYASLGRRAFVAPARAKRIVSHAADMELIEMVEQTSKDFTARFPRWARWQVKDPTGAERKSRQRERERDGDVT
jgi:hypothetical protein